ncbi:Hypothetical predicted protein, partial [Olea europaea subsp. europaea]
ANPKIHSPLLTSLNLLSIITSGVATIFGKGHSSSLHHRRVVHLSSLQHHGIVLNSIPSIPTTQLRTITVALCHHHLTMYHYRIVRRTATELCDLVAAKCSGL